MKYFLLAILIIVFIIINKEKYKNYDSYPCQFENTLKIKLSDTLSTFNKEKEIEYILNLQSKIPEEDRKEIAYKYDNIYRNVKDYISYNEYKQYHKETSNCILHMKYYFNVKRPVEFDDRIKVVYLKSAQTPSYPSGHSTQYWYLYLVIKKYKKIDIKNITENGGKSRIIAGVHFPIDDVAGKMLAEYIFSRYHSPLS